MVDGMEMDLASGRRGEDDSPDGLRGGVDGGRSKEGSLEAVLFRFSQPRRIDQLERA